MPVGDSGIFCLSAQNVEIENTNADKEKSCVGFKVKISW